MFGYEQDDEHMEVKPICGKKKKKKIQMISMKV